MSKKMYTLFGASLLAAGLVAAFPAQSVSADAQVLTYNGIVQRDEAGNPIMVEKGTSVKKEEEAFITAKGEGATKEEVKLNVIEGAIQYDEGGKPSETAVVAPAVAEEKPAVKIFEDGIHYDENGNPILEPAKTPATPDNGNEPVVNPDEKKDEVKPAEDKKPEADADANKDKKPAADADANKDKKDAKATDKKDAKAADKKDAKAADKKDAKATLPKTGEAASAVAAVGFAGLVVGLVAFFRFKKAN